MCSKKTVSFLLKYGVRPFLSEYKRLAAPFLRIRPTIRITLSSSPPFVSPAADHSLQSHVSFVCPEASSSVQHPTSRPRGFPLQYPSLSIVACAHFPPVPMRFKLIQSKRTQVVPLTPHARTSICEWLMQTISPACAIQDQEQNTHFLHSSLS